MIKTFFIETPLDKFAIDKDNTTLKDITEVSPINTLGQLREMLKDYSDDTVIALGLVPMWKDGTTPEVIGQKRAHRIYQLKEGTLKNKNKYVCLMSGQDITNKVWHINGLIVDDTSSSNKENTNK